MCRLPFLVESFDALREVLGKQLPKLAGHLEAHGVDVSLFATQWFLCLGLDQSMPFDMSLRLIDAICFERSARPLFCVTLALLSRGSEALLAIDDMMTLMAELKRLPFTVSDVEEFFAKAVARVRVPAGVGAP